MNQGADMKNQNDLFYFFLQKLANDWSSSIFFLIVEDRRYKDESLNPFSSYASIELKLKYHFYIFIRL